MTTVLEQRINLYHGIRTMVEASVLYHPLHRDPGVNSHGNGASNITLYLDQLAKTVADRIRFCCSVMLLRSVSGFYCAPKASWIITKALSSICFSLAAKSLGQSTTAQAPASKESQTPPSPVDFWTRDAPFPSTAPMMGPDPSPPLRSPPRFSGAYSSTISAMSGTEALTSDISAFSIPAPL
jgi:hypothetical protein